MALRRCSPRRFADFAKGLCTDIRTENIMVLCPGQGAQYTGMFAETMTNSTTEKLVQQSIGILGYDIRMVANNGSKDVLDRTVHCQPATVLSSIIAFENLKTRFTGNEEKTNLKVKAVAGYSVGELSALYVSGKMAFNDVLSLVKVRAEAMQYASDAQPTGMLSMQGLTFEQADELCADVSNSHPGNNHYIQVAIRQYPSSVLLAGSSSLLNSVVNREHKLLDSTVKVTAIPVNGAFHTNYMKPAQDIVHQSLQRIEILPSTIPLYSNQTGHLYHSEDEIREFLIRQICEPVQWDMILRNISELFGRNHFDSLYEVGPGKNLKTMIGKVNRRAIRSTHCIPS